MASESGAWHLDLILAENGEDPVLLEAYGKFDSGSPYEIKPSSIGGKKELRAICILLLVAKDRGAEHAERDGLLHFKVHTRHNTWLKTLGGYEHDKKAVSEDVFRNEFKQDRFWEGFPGSFHSGGDSPPHAKFNPHKLPLENLRIFTRPVDGTERRELIESDEIRKFAVLLEVRIVSKKPEKSKKPKKTKTKRKHFNKGTWSSGIVPTILRQTDKLKAKLKEIDYAKPLYFSSSSPTMSGTPLKAIGKEILYYLRKDSSEEACIALFKHQKTRHQSVCNEDISSFDFPLLTAISFRRHHVVDYLLSLPEIDVNKKNSHGTTPLLKAAQLNHITLIERLLAKDADPHARNEMGANALDHAVFGATPECLETIKYFERLGLRCDDRPDVYLLLVATFRCSAETIQYLNKPAFLPKIFGSPDSFSGFITSLGTHSRFPFTSQNALYTAVQNGQLEVVKEMLQFSSNVTIDEGETLFERTSPLQEAVANQSPDMIQLLLSHGANPFHQDNHGRLPRDFLPFRKAWRERTIELLLSQFERLWNESEFNGMPVLVPKGNGNKNELPGF